MNKGNFGYLLLVELVANLCNYQIDKYDRISLWKKIKRKSKIFIKAHFKGNGFQNVVETVKELEPYFDGLGYLYEKLEDDASKKLLVLLVAQRVLGGERIKLPINTEYYWKKRREAYSLKSSGQKILLNNRKICIYDLHKLGYKLKVLTVQYSIFIHFFLGHYCFRENGVTCEPGKGDHILDCGGGWGDTALFFADKAGAGGMVYTFEFIPEHIDIIQKNIELNPHIKNNIKIIEKALWNTSREKFFFSNNSLRSKVAAERQSGSDLEVLSTSIDDFVKEDGIEKINFIKMDIEGVELRALQGARETIKRFRPKLAISIYHNLEDFGTIPAFIDSLGCGYKFYLGHYTLGKNETVLYGVPDTGNLTCESR